MMKNPLVSLIGLLALVLCLQAALRPPLPLTADQGPGELDPTFNVDGLLGTLPASDHSLHAVLVQPDGKTVTVGEINGQIFVMRVTQAGYADTSFGALGFVIPDLSAFGYGGAVGQAVAIQADGKLLIGGFAATFQALNDWIVIRLNSDGSFDTSFDGDGLASVTAPSNDILTDLALQTDGRILATGFYLDSNGQSGVTIVRWQSNGQLDSSFDQDGIWGTPSDNVVLNPQIDVMPNGRVVMAGANLLSGAASSDFFVIRLLGNGQLDTTLGLVGSVQVESSASHELLGDLLVESNGAMVLVGETSGGSVTGMAILRLTASGGLDATFNDDGLLALDINGSQSAVGTGIARQADGKYVIVGRVDHFSTVPGNYFDSFATRLTANGQLDSSFASNGTMTIDIGQALGGSGGVFDGASALAIDPHGKVVVAGSVIDQNVEYGYVMRLETQATIFLPLVIR